jgi:thiol-disulfide isomerase/thioredoxin
VLKGWQLLTEPLAGSSIWSCRAFLIFQVEFELAVGIWFLSGLFRKTAWLAAVCCFSLFSVVSFYKGITGAASCGCFGPVHLNPWITLFAIDLPAVIALWISRPKLSFGLTPTWAFTAGRGFIKGLVREFTVPWPSTPRLTATICIGLATLCLTTPILALNEPAKITSTYEVLEPETWVGKELPILEHTDIADSLKQGTWVVLFYHYDCPDCAKAIPTYEQMARELAGDKDFLRVAFIEVPPYRPEPISEASPCILGRLADAKQWFITTPAVALLVDGEVTAAWEEKAPSLQDLMDQLIIPAKSSKTTPAEDK